MRAKEHRCYEEEKQRLHETTTWIDKQEVSLEEERKKAEQEVVSLKKQVKSALDERLVLKEQLVQMLKEEQAHLIHAQGSPYFGRVDFKENFQEEIEPIYIGKFGIYDAKQGDMLVLDWRSPMANIYYSGIDEDVSYKAPKGRIEGKMLLKRRYVIEQGELSEIHDEKSLQQNLADSIVQGSEFLIESLNKSTSGRLKEIVATIQEEQNQIIRSESFLPLIVQGVAGSGKTTIALHRMAYLIYNQQNPNLKYMVVAPNQLFLNYIAEILPDLGVNNVVQTTFEDWAIKQLGKGIKLDQKGDKLDTLLIAEESVTKVLALASKLRGSIVFQKIIDRRLKTLEANLLVGHAICYEGKTIISDKELQHIFEVSNAHLPYKERLKLLGDYIKKKLNDEQPVITNLIEKSYQEQIKKLKASTNHIESVRKEIIALFDERDEKIKGIKKWCVMASKDYIKQITLPSSKAFYLALFEDEDYLLQLLKDKMPEELLKQVIVMMREQLEKDLLETEDLGPLLYIHMRLNGIKEEKQYAHIVVDEAQDLDEMKLMVLRRISSNDSFTLVGDLAQGIYGYKGINDWQKVMARVFEEKRYNYFEMTTSYRSTIEIIELANRVIQSCEGFTPQLAKPVLRHGEKPKLIRCQDDEERMQQITSCIKAYQEKGFVSICIMTKDKEEGKTVYKKLKQAKIDVQWIEKEKEGYQGKVVVMPSYLAKGLEFDGVILYDVGRSKFSSEPLDIKLLYVMITRALHEITMYTTQDIIPVLLS